MGLISAACLRNGDHMQGGTLATNIMFRRLRQLCNNLHPRGGWRAAFRSAAG